jgi:uncharacterized protein YbaP (TraB family)
MPSKLAILFALLMSCCQFAVGAGTGAGLVEGAVQHRGQLYRVTHEGKTSYLFGTIHVGRDGIYPLDPVVSRALLDSKALVIELDIREDAAFQLALARHGRYADGDRIQNHLTPATLQKTVTALARAGYSLQSVQHYKPWLIANLLVGAELDLHGFQRSQAVEYALLAAAQKQEKTVRELESADYQLSLFDSLSAGFMNRVLLGKRNPEMAANIERIMQQDQVAFVGVGLLHLVGENGLPQLLKRRGYLVEQLY